MKKKFVAIISFIMIFALVFNMSTVTAYAAVPSYDNPYDDNGFRIKNWDIIANMTKFGSKNNNCCGMIAMGILLQFYNELDTCYQGQYVTGQLDYNTNSNGENNLRDELINLTPTAYSGLFGNASNPETQEAGLNNYINKYCRNLNIGTGRLLGTDDNTQIWIYSLTQYLIENNFPILLTMLNYYDPVKNENNHLAYGEAHTVVAYGYRIKNGEIQYLCHTGWSGAGYRAVWFSQASLFSLFVYGFTYLYAPVGHDVSKAGTLANGHQGEVFCRNQRGQGYARIEML